MFYAGLDADAVLRFNPSGDVSLFDTLPEPSSLVLGMNEVLFVAAGQPGVGTTMYRYDALDPQTRTILSFGFLGFSATPNPISISADDSTLYFLEAGGNVFNIDTQDGTKRLLANVATYSDDQWVNPGGIAVFSAPPPMLVPTVTHWGIITIALSIPVIFRLMNTWGVAR